MAPTTLPAAGCAPAHAATAAGTVAPATSFVGSVLGPLAARDASTAVLRGTLLVWLDAGERAPAAARRLGLHRNTILQRVARAEALLGYPVADRRLAVHLALELAERLGLPG